MGYNPERHNRHSIRLRNYNYANAGVYFITICCKNRNCLFGEIIAKKMILNKFGKIAYNEWVKTVKIRSNVKLHEFIAMPNHFHGIVEILWNGGNGVGVGFGENESGVGGDIGVCGNELGVCENKWGIGENKWGVCNTPLRGCGYATNMLQSPSNTIGAIVRGYKSAVTKQIYEFNRRGVLHTPHLPSNSPPHLPIHFQPDSPSPNQHPTHNEYQSVWQRNYYEHIIRTETEFARIAKYIRNNPIVWKKDCFYQRI